MITMIMAMTWYWSKNLYQCNYFSLPHHYDEKDEVDEVEDDSDDDDQTWYWLNIYSKAMFGEFLLAVQDSSIGDLVTQWVRQTFDFSDNDNDTTEQSRAEQSRAE